MKSEGKREGKKCGLPEIGEESPRLREASRFGQFLQITERP